MTEQTQKTDTDETQAFSFFDFTLEETAAADRQLIARGGPRDGRICTCGHPVSRHTQVAGIVLCKPTRMECPCKTVRAVLEASDTRSFLRKTSGGGALHALSRGLYAALQKGGSVEWIVDQQCDRCKKPGPVSPVPVTQRGTATDQATGYDALLCGQCRSEV